MPEVSDSHIYYSFTGWANVLQEFGAPSHIPEPEFVYAIYNHPDYAGEAAVIYCQDGAWHANYGAHCSCYGLEGSGWEPEVFDPTDHFLALLEGKRIVTAQDTENEFPQATSEFFDLWLYRHSIGK